MAKAAYVYSGTDWVPLASEVTNLTGYQTKALNQFAHRNFVINGDMQIAQRGTSTASITSDTYATTDRWRFLPSSQGTWTMSVENDAPTGSGFRKSTKVLCTTADASPAGADYVRLDQRIEGQNLQVVKKGTAAAEQLTISFWVKANVTGTYIVSLYDNDNNRVVSKSYTINASATWEYKTITFPADTTGALDNDNDVSLILIFRLGVGSNYSSGTLQTTWATYSDANSAVGQTNVASATNNYWQITGVQLEVGPTATPFEFKSVEDELVECQRYFIRYTDAQYYAQWTSGGFMRFQIPLPVTQRVGGTFSYTGTLQTNIYYEVAGVGTTGTINSLSDLSANATLHMMQVTFSANPSAGAGRLITSGSSFDFSAEL
jgi:hypothetical protein